jgi:Fibronectin type III domain/Carbohydrate binding domain/Glycosyl hydrolases family 18
MRPPRLLALLAAPAAVLLACGMTLTASAAPAAAATNLLANPGFESGTLSGWTCSAIDSVTASPVHSGSRALEGAANNSDNAQCTQAVSVQPNSAYTLTGWVEGNYVYIGDTGTGTTDTSNWTPSATTWKQLSTSFSTGASTTSLTIYVHGWYAQGTYFADDLSLTGPGGTTGGGGGGTTVPAAPTGLTVTGTTASSASLSWTAPTGTVTGYNVYQNGTRVSSASATSATVAGLAAATTYTFKVTAANSAGESAASGSVQATTSAAAGGGGGGSGAGSFTVAPYADMTNNQEPVLNAAATSGGLKAFSAAFLIGSGCTPIWGDTLPVTNDPTVTSEITTAESDGAQPIISFGGADGAELAQSCTNLSQLTAAYQSVITTLHVTHLDWDIEGAGIADTADNATRFQAIKALESANPSLVVSVTIPVNPNGPDNNGRAFLQQAHSSGARIDVINVMAMDYGGSWDTGGANMGAYAVETAQDTLAFARTLWPSMTYANIGVTPMIGQNDDSAEVFTKANAQTLLTFAEQNHLGRLSFWSVDRDQPCAGSATGLSGCSETTQSTLDFTKIFTQYTG